MLSHCLPSAHGTGPGSAHRWVWGYLLPSSGAWPQQGSHAIPGAAAPQVESKLGATAAPPSRDRRTSRAWAQSPGASIAQRANCCRDRVYDRALGECGRRLASMCTCCICGCVHVCVHVSVCCVPVGRHACVHVLVYARAPACLSVCLCVCTCPCTCVCMCVCACTCVFVDVCLCVYASVLVCLCVCMSCTCMCPCVHTSMCPCL